MAPRDLARPRQEPIGPDTIREMREATSQDRAHLAAIAAGERQSEADRVERALRVPPGERILEGFRLGAETAWTPAHLAELDARTDGEMELARRRIALGLNAEHTG